MRVFKILLKSFLSVFAIMRVCSVSAASPISIIIFALLVYAFAKIQGEAFQGRIEPPADHILSSVLCLLFTGFTIAALPKALPVNFAGILAAAGLLIIYYHLALLILCAGEYVHITGTLYHNPWFPYLAALLCLICHIPYFLYEYPAVMTSESMNQYAQMIGEYALNNRFPVVHTVLTGWFYGRGIAFINDAVFGIAVCTIAQMIFMAFVAGYVIKTLQKAGIITPIIGIVICFYALMPYNGILSVTMLSDIPFAGCMTLFCAVLLRIMLRPDSISPTGRKEKIKIGEYFSIVLPYVFSTVMISLLKTNGWYVFLISIPFILFVYKSAWKLTVPMTLAALAIVLFVKYPCMEIYEISQNDTSGTVSYMRPGTFNEYILQTRGFWYPDVQNTVRFDEGICNNDLGLESRPLIDKDMIDTVKDILFNHTDTIPVYGAFWSIGFMLWLLLAAAALCIKMQNAANLLICLPLCALMIMLCTIEPVRAEFKAAYSLAYSLPLFMTVPFIRRAAA